MPCSYILLEGAQAELDSILSYLCKLTGETKAARDFADEFERQIAIACENPEIHALSRIPELARLGYRAMLVKNYVVLYAYRNEVILVTHVFHQRQDYAKLV